MQLNYYMKHDMQHVLFKSAQLIAATFVQGNHDIHDDLCKYKA